MHYIFLIISWKAQQIQFHKYIKKVSAEGYCKLWDRLFKGKVHLMEFGQFYKQSKENGTTHTSCASPSLINKCTETSEIVT